MAEQEVDIRALRAGDVAAIVAALREAGWEDADRFRRHWERQCNGERAVLVAWRGGSFCGYLTVTWNPDYPPLQERGIPEVQDFNVLPAFQRQGIGGRLMDEAERLVAQRSSTVGIGVGLYAGYGTAQRLYVRRGYVPDGRGITIHNRDVVFGEQVQIDDELVLHFTKDLTT